MIMLGSGVAFQVRNDASLYFQHLGGGSKIKITSTRQRTEGRMNYTRPCPKERWGTFPKFLHC